VPLLNTLVPRDFRNAITPQLKRYFLGTVLGCIGNGLTFSMFVIYVHNVRHFSIWFASMLLVIGAVSGLLCSPIIGTLVDKFGPVLVLVPSLVLEAISLVVWAYAHSYFSLIASNFIIAITGGAFWGPGSTLLSRLIDEQHRQRAFGINFMFVNLGIGFGGLIAASIVDLNHPFSFTVLYLLNAATALGIAIVFTTLWKYGKRDDSNEMTEEQEEEGWRDVLKDKRLMRYVAASLILMLGGYGSQEAGFSLFVVNNLKIPVHVIGIMFFCNTTTIIASQLFITNLVENKSRTRVMALAGLLWFGFWFILFAALKMPEILAVVSICIGMGIFAIGETLINPVGSALINEIAPEHLRGRYNAASGLTWGVSSMVAAAFTSILFSSNLGSWWPLFIGSASLGGSLMMLSLRKSLTPKEDGRITQ